MLFGLYLGLICNPNFLSNEEDIKTILEGVKLARRVIKTKPLSDIVVKEFLPGRLVDSDNDLVNYCKKMIKTNISKSSEDELYKDGFYLMLIDFKKLILNKKVSSSFQSINDHLKTVDLISKINNE